MSESPSQTRLARLETLFSELAINVTKYTHPPLKTCQDADLIGLERKGTRVKNLFLRDNYGKRHFLLLVPAECQVDLKALSKAQHISRLGFASPQRLKKFLAVQPGCVSALALFNDEEAVVELWIESELWQAEQLQCHPLYNDKTWVINKDDLVKFFQHTQHRPQIISVPRL